MPHALRCRTASSATGTASTVASTAAAALYTGGVRGRVEHRDVAAGSVGGSPVVIQYTSDADRHAEREHDQGGEHARAPASVSRPSRIRGGAIRWASGRSGNRAAAAAERALAGQHQQAEQDEHQRQRAGGGGAEAELELGEDLGREGLEAEDLERAELGEQDERRPAGSRRGSRPWPGRASPWRRCARGRRRGCGRPPPSRGRRRAGWPPPAGRPAGTRPGSSRSHAPVKPCGPGPQRVPAEADHEVGDGQRDARRAPPRPGAPGRSVRSTHHAAAVPITAQATVTTAVSRTVFHSRDQVSGRKIRLVQLGRPGPGRLDQQEDQRDRHERGHQRRRR